jgi:dTDP-4-amino-4,6-dideoxygalactose transaminase
LERKYLAEVIDSDTLSSFLGTKVRAFERRFAEMYGMKHCVACSSGASAVHVAIASLGLPAGSEVITSAMAGMGTAAGILCQGLIPVFADVEPHTLNMSPVSVQASITRRTGAIVALHHAGLAAEMDSLQEIGESAGLAVVEDCGQAYWCDYRGKLAGTLGAISAFSLDDSAHINCGAGGMGGTARSPVVL